MSESPFSAGQRAVSLGVGAAQNMKSFVGRSSKIATPITMICGMIADLASTIGRFSLYLLIISIGLAVLSGFMWFARYRREFLKAASDGVMQPDEVKQLGESNVWSVTFAFSIVASVVMGGFVIADQMAGKDNKGVIASVVPGMDKVQESLFRVEKKIDSVKEDTVAIREEAKLIRNDTASLKQDTTAVREDTAKIVASVEEIAKRFEGLASSGGIIPGAKTPEEHYHNARVHELGGNFSAARKEYTEYLAANLDVLDPWMSYSAMLKVQEGREGTMEAMRYFGDKLTPRTASYETAMALLEERDARLKKLTALAEKHPDYGPLAYLISQEYSEVKRGEQTLADKRAEKEWLEKFRAANEGGKFIKFFLDKKEAQKWVDTAEASRVKLESMPAQVLENPVSLTAMQSNAGWAVNLSLTDFKVKELFYKLDGKGDFVSTGHQAFQNPQTGLPMVNMHLPLPDLAPGEHTLEVKYVDKNDQTNGPYTLKFSTADQQMTQGKTTLSMLSGSWLSFRDFDGKLLLYFTTLMSYRPVIQEIKYSIDSEALDQTFKFKPTDKMYEVGDDIYLAIPKDSKFVNVQVIYKDGTKSLMQTIRKK